MGSSQNGFAQSHHHLLRVNGWVMLFYALHGATYPIQRLAAPLRQDSTEFMNLTGLFSPDAIRFAIVP